MKQDVEIELENGQKVYSLFDASELPTIDSTKDVVFFLSDGKILVGKSDGDIITVDDENGNVIKDASSSKFNEKLIRDNSRYAFYFES